MSKYEKTLRIQLPMATAHKDFFCFLIPQQGNKELSLSIAPWEE
jgi:hypothetical protein